jgi:DNA invertase Pin-like site-specific DNA recombinase
VLIGYMRVSKADGSQSTDLQRDALIAAGVDPCASLRGSSVRQARGSARLASCLKALREGDTLVVWKLDRLGRDLRHLINTVHDLTGRGIGLKVLTGHGAAIDTTTAAGKLVFGIFAALAEFERELIAERTVAGLILGARSRQERRRPFKMTAAKLRLAMAAWGNRKPRSAICARNSGLPGRPCIGIFHPRASYVQMARSYSAEFDAGMRQRSDSVVCLNGKRS